MTTILQLKMLMHADRLLVRTGSVKHILNFFDVVLHATTQRHHLEPIHETYDASGRIIYHPDLPKDILTKTIMMRVYNPLTQRFEIKERNYVRGIPKPGHFHTKKLSVSLLPRHGKTLLYKFSSFKFGVFLDLSKCTQKDEKYCFLFDAYTDEKWWLNFSENYPKTPMFVSLPRPKHLGCISLVQSPEYFRGYSFSQLVEIINNFDLYLGFFDEYKKYSQNTKYEKIFSHDIREILIRHCAVLYNELLVGVSLESVLSIFYVHDDVLFDAIYLRESIKERYALDIPIFKYETLLGKIFG